MSWSHGSGVATVDLEGFDGIAIILMENNSLLRELGEKTQ